MKLSHASAMPHALLHDGWANKKQARKNNCKEIENMA
jgi:hypothetical protein